jgi:hypothetical protein
VALIFHLQCRLRSRLLYHRKRRMATLRCGPTEVAKGTEGPTYKQVYLVADHCFMAVSISFYGGTGGAAANGVRNCLTEQARVKDELDKRGVSNWDTP